MIDGHVDFRHYECDHRAVTPPPPPNSPRYGWRITVDPNEQLPLHPNIEVTQVSTGNSSPRRQTILRLFTAGAIGTVTSIGLSFLVPSSAEIAPLRLPNLVDVCDGPVQVHNFLYGRAESSLSPTQHVALLVKNGLLASGNSTLTVDDSMIGSSSGFVRILDEHSEVVAVAKYVHDDSLGWMIEEAAECV